MMNELKSRKMNKRESCSWLSNEDLIEGTEALIEPALITNYLKFLFRLLKYKSIIANKNSDFRLLISL